MEIDVTDPSLTSGHPEAIEQHQFRSTSLASWTGIKSTMCFFFSFASTILPVLPQSYENPYYINCIQKVPTQFHLHKDCKNTASEFMCMCILYWYSCRLWPNLENLARSALQIGTYGSPPSCLSHMCTRAVWW